MNVEVGTVRAIPFLVIFVSNFGIGSMQCSASSYTCAKKDIIRRISVQKSATSKLNFSTFTYIGVV